MKPSFVHQLIKLYRLFEGGSIGLFERIETGSAKGNVMAKVICPHCGAVVSINAQSVNFFEKVATSLTCGRCRKQFDLPSDVRKKLQACKDIDDLATLDFLADGEIDGRF